MSCTPHWRRLTVGLWVYDPHISWGLIERRKGRFAVVNWWPNDRWCMGMEGITQRTVYRRTLRLAKQALLERHLSPPPIKP